jgi:hypothetical protein
VSGLASWISFIKVQPNWLLLIFFIAIQVPFLARPIEHLEFWRQADTEAVARNLAFETFDPLRPRLDLRGDKTGITGMEFPLYEAIVAGGYWLAGDSDAVGKVISLVAILLAWLILAKLLVRSAGVDRWAATAAIGSCPILFILGSRILPDPLALLLGVIALERFDAYANNRGRAEIYAGAGALALAILVRPYVISFGLPLLWFWLDDLIHRKRALFHLVVGLAVLLPFSVWYFYWWPHLVQTYGLKYFFGGIPLTAAIAELLHFGFWLGLVTTVIKYYVNWLCLPFAMWGAIHIWRTRELQSDASLAGFWLPMLAVGSLCLVSGDHFQDHPYYLLALVPSSVLLVATGLSALRDWRPHLGIAACVLVVILTPVGFWKFFLGDELLAAYQPLTREIGVRTTVSQLVLIEEIDESPRVSWYLNQIRRRGWVEAPCQVNDIGNIEELKHRGLRWVVWYDGHAYRLSDVQSWILHLERLGRTSRSLKPECGVSGAS